MRGVQGERGEEGWEEGGKEKGGGGEEGGEGREENGKMGVYFVIYLHDPNLACECK